MKAELIETDWIEYIKHFSSGDVVKYERFNCYSGLFEIVTRSIEKTTKYTIFLRDDVLSCKDILRLKKYQPDDDEIENAEKLFCA